DVSARVRDLARGRSRRARLRYAEGGAERGERAWHGRLHLTPVERDCLLRKGRKRAANQRRLADPARAMYGDDGWPVRGQQGGKTRSLFGTAYEGDLRRCRHALRYRALRPTRAHPRMLEDRVRRIVAGYPVVRRYG